MTGPCQAHRACPVAQPSVRVAGFIQYSIQKTEMLRLGGGIYYLFYLKTEKHILYLEI